jgi:fatty acid desaturase
MIVRPQYEEHESDHSHDFHRIRGALCDSSGRRYADFVQSLRPSYVRVWLDISLGYLALVATMAALAFATGPFLPMLAAYGAAALSVGYWIAYLQLFMHEGAHYNLAAKRVLNDVLANVWVCAIGGQEVSRYRRIHFQHHRALGTTDDSENSYFHAPTWKFLTEVVLGVRSFRVFRNRGRALQGETGRGYLSPWVLETVLIHGGAVLGALFLRRIDLAATWLAGWLLAFPFWGALRNILEHRSEHASASTDYFRENHGPHTRLFGHDPLSATFGGAGFNRHLLHHWEPQVSYTRLGELEIFLMNTPMKAVIHARRSSYWATLIALMKRGMARG